MEQNKKTVFRGTEPFEYRAEEAFCEKMSREGWMLDTLTTYTTTFKKAEPAERRFRIDIYPDAHVAEKKKALNAYKNDWRKAGYKFAGNNDLYFYFYSDDLNAEAPKCAGKNEKKLIHSAVWRKELYCGLITALVLLYGGIKLYSSAYTDFVTFSGVSKTFLLPVFILPFLIRLIPFVIRFVRNKKTAERGEPLPVVPYKTARRHWRFTFGLVIALMVWILLGIILDACTGSPRTILLLSPVAVVAAVIGLIRGMKKRGGSRLAARVIIIIAVVLCIGAYAVFNYTEFSQKTVADNEYIRHLATEVTTTKFNRTASPLAKEHFIYVEWDADGNRAQTEYFNCTGLRAADLIYQKIEKRLAGADIPEYDLQRDGNIIVYTDFIQADK